MKPTYLSFENVKGRDGQFDLAPINIFTGMNGAGKSAVLWAITLATLAYHPKLGKHNIKSKKLMSGRRMDMTSTLRFDDSTSNFYALKLQPDGDLKKTIKFDHKEIPEVLYDLHEYLNADGKERIKSVTSKIDDKTLEFDEKFFIDSLKEIEVLPAVECKPAIEELIKFVTERFARRTKAKMKLQDFLELLVKELEDEKKRYKTLKDQASAQMIGNRSATTPKSAQSQIDEINKQLEPLNKRLTELKSVQENISKQSIRRNELNNIIARSVPDTTEKKTFLQNLRTDINSYVNPVPAIEKELKNYAEDPTRKELIQQIADNKKNIDDTQASIEGLASHKKCPYCRSSRKDWKEEYEKELKESLVTYNAEEKKFQERAESFKSKKADIEKRLTDARDQHVKNKSDLQTKEQKMLSLESEIKQADQLARDKSAAEAELKGMTEATGTVDPNEIEKLQIDISALEAKLVPLNEQQKTYTEFDAGQKSLRDKEKNLLAAQTREEVFKRAISNAVDEQSKIVSLAFKPIIEKARLFTDGILPGELDYNEGDIGMHGPDGWVDHVCMGTFHQTIAYIGISVALAQQSPTKIVLLDEAGIIHPKNKPIIARRLIELHKNGVIDGAFITDPTATGWSDVVDTSIQIVDIPG